MASDWVLTHPHYELPVVKHLHLIRICILASVDNAKLIFSSYYTHMLSSEDTNNVKNVTMPEQIRMCGSRLILESFYEIRICILVLGG
jgi:hypothetical protein